jgi:biofilm PGA synthesis N-glycosyltransferase PgaC
MELLFWTAIAIVFYTFLGYGILLYVLVVLKRIFSTNQPPFDPHYCPSVTFVVPCYNEADTVVQKIDNCLSLAYPENKLTIIFITDGSDDGTPALIQQFPSIKLLHDTHRAGKAAAENRAMLHIQSEITIFSDANTLLPNDAIYKLVRHYQDPKVGAVAGEKRIQSKTADQAAGAGEGIYWKYESLLKRLDAELHTIVGAAGELFSFRTALFSAIEKDTILDDFILSMRIAAKGYHVLYEPEAYAMETASVSIKEELKRKVRICAGGWQAMSRLLPILNPFPNFVLSFQYLSHRVLRWTIVPLLLIFVLVLNMRLAMTSQFYLLLLLLQLSFYGFAIVGWLLENKNIKLKTFFVPYYFLIMNYSVIAGFVRFIQGRQSAAWERSKRSK